MKPISFYDPVTGLFTGQGYRGPKDQIPAGDYVEGEYDPARWRVENGKVVACEVPDGHVWHAGKFVPRARLDAARLDAELRAEIARLERTQQRPIREHIAGDPEALGRVLDIDAKIAQLRKELAKYAL